MKRFFAPEALFFVGLMTALLTFGRSVMLRDPGTLWHSTAGERMLASGHILRADPFSISMAGHPWVPMEWLSECVMALVFRAGGWDALLLVTTAVVAAINAVLSRRLLRAGCHPLLVAGLLTLGLAVGANHIIVRPLIASLAFFTWTFAALVDIDAGRKKLSSALWLIPAVAVWSNLHGGVLGGLGTTMLVMGSWGLFRACRLSSPVTSLRHVAFMSLVGASALIATLVNPFGVDLPMTWLRILASPNLGRLLGEHAPLATSPLTALAVTLLCGCHVALLVGVDRANLRGTMFVPLVWFVMTWSKITYAPYFAISVLLSMPDVLPRCRWLTRMTAGTDSLFELRARGSVGTGDLAVLVLPMVMVATAAVLHAAGIVLPLFGAGWARLDPTTAPLDVRDALDRAAAALPEGTGILNDLDYGGFCIFFEPRLRVFVDDRYELYGPTFLQSYMDAKAAPAETAEVFASRFDLRVALLRRGSALDRGVEGSPRWRVLARGATANLYARR